MRGWAWVERYANTVALLGLALTLLCMFGFDDRRASFVANVFGYPVLAVAMTALVAAAATQRGLLARLRVPGAQWIAVVSYSLYLSHKMVYGQLHGRFAPWVDDHGIWTALIYVAAVVVVGAALHYAVERPFLNLRGQVRRTLLAKHHTNAGSMAPVPENA